MLIKFVKSTGSYAKGDIAGFEDAVAEKYIKAEVAEAYKAPKTEKSEASKPEGKNAKAPKTEK